MWTKIIVKETHESHPTVLELNRPNLARFVAVTKEFSDYRVRASFLMFNQWIGFKKKFFSNRSSTIVLLVSVNMCYIFIVLLFNNRICSHLPGSTLSKTKFPNQDFSGQTSEIERTDERPKNVFWTTRETPCVAYGIFSIERVLCKIFYSFSSFKLSREMNPEQLRARLAQFVKK